jgi:hypothetical protein
MTTGMDVAGQDFLSLVVKSTYDFPKRRGGVVQPSEKQAPLVMADEYFGEPGFSAPKWETDFAFRKGRCDVVLQGAAYAPDGQPAERVPVGLRVGRWQKGFHVVGHREWRVVGPSISTTSPVRFRRAEFNYGTAFGGTDRTNPDDPKPPAYLANPHGRGFASFRNQGLISGQPLPNTEVPGEPVTSPYGEYAPMALGPIFRAVPARQRYAGTYDKNWEDNVFPFLPKDFDERYFQSVGKDQQIDPPAPGTEIVLLNLTPDGKTAMQLPDTELPVRIFGSLGSTLLETVRRPDTVTIEPEARRLSLVWRVEAPIRRHLSEFVLAWVGHPSKGMRRSRQGRRLYVPMRSLDELGS